MNDASRPLWTIDEVAQYIGAASTGSARRTLSRLQVRPVSRQPGRAGVSLYDPEQVRAAHEGRPGRGYRTDLHTRPTSGN